MQSECVQLQIVSSKFNFEDTIFSICNVTSLQLLRLAMRWSWSAIEWCQIGNYRQSVSDNAAFNCDELSKRPYLSLSAQTKRHI